MIDYSKYEGHTPGPWDRGPVCGRVTKSGARYPHPPDQTQDDGESWLAMRQRIESHLEEERRVLAANDALGAAAPELLARCKALEAEVERLREALEEMLDPYHMANCDAAKEYPQPCPTCEHARAALLGEEADDAQ